MKLLIKRSLEKVQASYWVVPTFMAVVGMLLVPAQYLVHSLLPDAVLQLSFFTHLQDMSVPTVRGILATVAGAAIGTASVVFSVSIVVLSLTASQFGPRLLKNFLKQGVAQVTLGTFIATFMFSLFGFTLLESTFSGVQLSYLLVATAIALGAGSFFVLIVYIDHIASFIQAPRVIDDASRTLMTRIRQLPEIDSDAEPTARTRRTAEQDAVRRELNTPHSGYVQSIDFDFLLDQATEHDLHLALQIYPGRFVLINQVVAVISSRCPAEVPEPDKLLAAFTIGSERSAAQDLNFSLDQMVEIALRALSPSINDPFTAINCINQLAAGLSLLAGRALPADRLFDEQGIERIERPNMRYEDAFDAAFSQIREYGCRDREVVGQLLRRLLELYKLPVSGDFRSAVSEQLRKLGEQIARGDATTPVSKRDMAHLRQVLEADSRR